LAHPTDDQLTALTSADLTSRDRSCANHGDCEAAAAASGVKLPRPWVESGSQRRQFVRRGNAGRGLNRGHRQGGPSPAAHVRIAPRPRRAGPPSRDRTLVRSRRVWLPRGPGRPPSTVARGQPHRRSDPPTILTPPAFYQASVVKGAAGRGNNSSSYGAIEVNRPNRAARRRRGKSDPVDAELAVRGAFRGSRRGPKVLLGPIRLGWGG
jgi:hypothetical protein